MGARSGGQETGRRLGCWWGGGRTGPVRAGQSGRQRWPKREPQAMELLMSGLKAVRTVLEFCAEMKTCD